MSSFEPDCPVLGRLVRLKISAQTGHRYTDIYICNYVIYVYRFRPSIFGSRTELGNRSRVSSFFSTCRPGNPTFNSHSPNMDTQFYDWSIYKQSICSYFQNIDGYKHLRPRHLTLWGDRPLQSPPPSPPILMSVFQHLFSSSCLHAK